MYESPRIANVQTITSAYGAGLLPEGAGANGCALVIAVLAVAIATTNVVAINIAVKVNVAASVNVIGTGNASLASPRKQSARIDGLEL